MPTKQPRDKITWASETERERVTSFLKERFGSTSAGLRAALDLLLKKHKQEKLDTLKWGGKRNERD